MTLVAALALALYPAAAFAGQAGPDEVQRRSQRARDALAQHDLERAVQEYAEILKLDPRNAEVHAAQGMALYGLGKPEEAASVLQTALALDSDQAMAGLFLGLSRADLGQCAEAVPLLRKNFNDRTEHKLRRLVGLSLLNCLRATSELETALETAQALKKRYPGDADVLYYAAALYSQLWNAAVADLVRAAPASYRVHQVAGEALEAQGREEQALKEYQKALDLNPKALRVHYRIGRLLLRMGKDADAVGKAAAHFRQELAVNPRDAASEYEIGEILRKARKPDEAAKRFLHALELAANYVDARVGLAKIYADQGQPAKAVAELEQAIRAEPENAPAHYALMLVYRDLGRDQDAGRELDLFQKLQGERERDFRSLLQSLLSAK
jgi:tetratricopeptide (TPR) repeat protein